MLISWWKKSCLAVLIAFGLLWLPYMAETTTPQSQARIHELANAPINPNDKFDMIVICGITMLKHPDGPIEPMYAPCYR